ncbi:MAG: hypothetical protein M3Y68_11040 [Chloroflexota bacterium]|nr:hypothetical protein [Chloroflexota bacterium]
MERTFPLKAQEQATGLRHFRRVIFDDLSRLYRLRDFLERDIALEHALNGMDAEQSTLFIH